MRLSEQEKRGWRRGIGFYLLLNGASFLVWSIGVALVAMMAYAESPQHSHADTIEQLLGRLSSAMVLGPFGYGLSFVYLAVLYRRRDTPRRAFYVGLPVFTSLIVLFGFLDLLDVSILKRLAVVGFYGLILYSSYFLFDIGKAKSRGPMLGGD